MFRLHGIAPVLPFVLALGACIDSEGPQIEVDLTQADFTIPSGGAAAVVRYMVNNAGDTFAYFRGCESPIPVVLERNNNGTWEEAADYNTDCASGVPVQELSLPPGASHLDSIPVTAASQYRLSVWFGSSIGAPYAYAVRSDNFQVH